MICWWCFCEYFECLCFEHTHYMLLCIRESWKMPWITCRKFVLTESGSCYVTSWVAHQCLGEACLRPCLNTVNLKPISWIWQFHYKLVLQWMKIRLRTDFNLEPVWPKPVPGSCAIKQGLNASYADTCSHKRERNSREKEWFSLLTHALRWPEGERERERCLVYWYMHSKVQERERGQKREV